MTPVPHVREFSRPAAPRALVLVLHGGREFGKAPVHPLRAAYLRMIPFAKDLASADPGLAVWLLRYRHRGWNAPDLDPVADARWALERVRERYGDVPVVLVGHSMGGRVALRVADDPNVTGVAALAPWTPAGEPVQQLAGKLVLIAHGDRDRMTDPRLSYAYARRAKQVTERVCRFDVVGESHAMLRRASEWTRLVRSFVLGAITTHPVDPVITNALQQPSPEGLRVPL